jgi:hypothetical protein
VLRLLQEGAVSAVGVRDDTQPNKPVKVRDTGQAVCRLAGWLHICTFVGSVSPKD